MLLTIDEEEEPLLGEEDEVPMEDVEDLLGEDPPTQEEQEPQISTTVEDPSRAGGAGAPGGDHHRASPK